MIRVELWHQDGLAGFVFEAKTGVVWTNQTGGTCCDHPSVEGVFVPMPAGWLPDSDPLLDYRSAYSAAMVETFLKAGSEELQAVFEPVGKMAPVDLEEAWVFVRVKKNDDPAFSPLEGKVGFITYTNSD